MATGFASSGLLEDYPTILADIEVQMKERINTLNLEEVCYMLKIFSQADSIGTSDGFYQICERFIGAKSSEVEEY